MTKARFGVCGDKEPPKATIFIVVADKGFVNVQREFFFQYRMAFWLQDTPSATIFAPVLLVTTVIGTVLNDVGAFANATA